MASNVYQGFANNVRYFARNFYRQHQLANVRDETHTDTGILTVLIDNGAQPLDEAVRIEVHRFELLNQLPQVGHLALHQLLNIEEFGGNILSMPRGTNAQGVEAKCDSVQGLDDAIVQVASHAGTLIGCGSGKQSAQYVYAVNRQRGMADD